MYVCELRLLLYPIILCNIKILIRIAYKQKEIELQRTVKEQQKMSDSISSTPEVESSLFDEYEKVVLNALLVEPSKDDSNNGLTMDMILSTTFPIKTIGRETDQKMLEENSQHRLKMWQAYEQGIPLLKIDGDTQNSNIQNVPASAVFSRHVSAKSNAESSTFTGDVEDIKSDSEVRHEKDLNDGSSVSSSKDEERHFDSWQVLKDEYAKDFGYDYEPDITDNDESDNLARGFQILGTYAEDVDAYPHVLSPPLMESLLNFVPESLSAENFWLKYSLVRDGASLETLRNYCKASANTILAIQTTTGDCFGCFTSSIWRIRNGYFGQGEPFIWRMRYNRCSPCFSLFEQAKLESEIDVFPFSSFNKEVQFCTHDMIGIGGGDLSQKKDDDVVPAIYTKSEALRQGFAFVLHDDLTRGMTSPSPTFCSPRLVADQSGVFDVMNLEGMTTDSLLLA